MTALIALSFGALIALTDASLVAADVIRAGDVVTASNTEIEPGAEDEDGLFGREARRTLYPGQAVTAENTRPARLVTRNQIVTVKYIHGALEITTTGRALGEAALNEPVTVLNLQSRQTVQGIVQENGWILAQ